MTVSVRHVLPEDVEAVHAIMLSPHVVRGSMRLPVQLIDHTRERLEPQPGVYKMVAHVEDEVVGYAELVTYPDAPRHRHVGEINMIVTHEDWQGKGVGRALMEAMVDMADNWLQLTRLGLVVWTSNERAVRLYESFGFKVEGTMPGYAFGEGEYIDAHFMGRVKIPG